MFLNKSVILKGIHKFPMRADDSKDLEEMGNKLRSWIQEVKPDPSLLLV